MPIDLHTADTTAKSQPATSEPSFGECLSQYVHDLRTQLVALRGYSRLIAEERAGPLNATQQEYLRIVRYNADRMVQLLSELSDKLTAMQTPPVEAPAAAGAIQTTLKEEGPANE